MANYLVRKIAINGSFCLPQSYTQVALMCRGNHNMEANINFHQKEVNFPVFNILILSFCKKKNFKELR